MFVPAYFNVVCFTLFLFFRKKHQESFKKKKRYAILYEEFYKKIPKKKWRDCKEYFDAIMKGEAQFDIDKLFPFIGIEKYYSMGGSSLTPHQPLCILNHPYYPEFKRRVEEIEFDEIVKMIDTFKNKDNK